MLIFLWQTQPTRYIYRYLFVQMEENLPKTNAKKDLS